MRQTMQYLLTVQEETAENAGTGLRRANCPANSRNSGENPLSVGNGRPTLTMADQKGSDKK